MPTTNRHPPTKRIVVAELMRETDLTAEAIAVKTGVPYATVCRWNQFHNWRPWFRRTPPAVDPRRWSKPRLAALERVYAQAGVDLGDLAQAVGTERTRWRAFFRECGFAERAAPPEEAYLGEGGHENLRGSLRRHVARRIASLDSELTQGPKDPVESRRMLREFAMLKDLVEEVEPADSAQAGQAVEDAYFEERAEVIDRIFKHFLSIVREAAGCEVPEEMAAEAAQAAFWHRIAHIQMLNRERQARARNTDEGERIGAPEPRMMPLV